jgi:hypothetical protein
MLRAVVWSTFTDVLEVLVASIIRAMCVPMMEAAGTFETSVKYYLLTAGRNILDDSQFQEHGLFKLMMA